MCGCGFSTCGKCLKTYLADSTSDADCMACHRPFDQAFLCDALGSGWVNGAYKKHKSKIMMDKEMARLASAQPAAKRVLDLEEKDEELLAIKREIRACQIKYQEKQHEKYVLRSGRAPIERKQFIHKCGVADCLGSLSTAWKCGMCDTFSCSKCHAVKGPDRDAAHTCNAEDIASVEEIKKSTRGCPSCGTAIYKIEGCDQMFCTMPGCETAFSFRTGRRETGRVHNPHYFEMRQQGLLGAVRAPGDIRCGGGPSLNLIRSLIEKAGATKYSSAELRVHPDPAIRDRQYTFAFKEDWAQKFNEDIYRGSAHFAEVIVNRLRERVTAAMDNEDLRVALLLKRTSEKKMKSDLARRDKKLRQDQAVLDIMEIFSIVLQEALLKVTRGERQLVAAVRPKGGGGRPPGRLLVPSPTVFAGVKPEEVQRDILDALEEIERVRTYCNGQLAKIASDFKVKAKFICENPCATMRV
jgi:hypothetical protein